MRSSSIRAVTSLVALASVTAQLGCSAKPAHPESVVIAAPIATSSADEPAAPVPQRADARRRKAGSLRIGETAHRLGFDLTLTAMAECEARYYEKSALKKAGQRLVGIEMTFEATSDTPFTPAPYNMRLIDSEGLPHTYSFRGTCEPRLQSSTLEETGTRSSGWVTFEVATGSTDLEFRYELDSDKVIEYDLGT
ncbi:MAG: DUF4352 domain-containing protein [Polyangiaceae bacterium]|nr:DUF4352 domain-containing protein [Polyangiaceae bacterium]MCB9607867.1 DUF4352 domain-containing protein [Polyangiaceae bacterium]